MDAKKGFVQIVEYLIAKGANIEAKYEEEKTPLQYAYENHNLDIVDIFHP